MPTGTNTLEIYMTNEVKAELNTLVEVIKNSLSIDEIYLFGSFAYGNPKSDSDFDIYVVIPDDSIRPIEATQKIRLNILPYQKRPVDLLVGKRSSFMKRKTSTSFIENEVSSKGMKIYG
jgi:predicted nucleotidyltransferase